MKKLAAVVAALLLAGAAFAQDSAKAFFAGLYAFATDNPNDGKEIYDARFITADTVNEEYSFSGWLLQKTVGYSRYDFVCSVKNNGDDFTLTVTNMRSYPCDRAGNKSPKAKINVSAAYVVKQFEKFFKEEVKSKIAAIPADKVEEKFTRAVSNPFVFMGVSETMSNIGIKKLVEKSLNGKTTELDLVVMEVDENPQKASDGLEYKAICVVPYQVNTVEDLNLPPLYKTESYPVIVCSNNDKLAAVKIGSTYKAKGKIDIENNNGKWVYFLLEE